MKRVVFDVIKRNIPAVLVWLLGSLVSLAVCLLYGSSLEPWIYAAVCGAFILLVVFIVEIIREKKKSVERKHELAAILSDWNNLSSPESGAEEDYQAMVTRLGTELSRVLTENLSEREDALDYYTNWVHQIKTPIAVMRLKLSDDTKENRELLNEIFRIEQYVDMVLQYMRIQSRSNDLVVQEYSVDEMVLETVHKFAPLFVEKRLSFDYQETGISVVTDRVWFMVILDQLLSNAIKYTPAGRIEISVQDGYLVVCDTGIGIASEDLPRIFEKGFTGRNGRSGRKSSGLGLYLVKKAADLLKIRVKVESTVGEGTRFFVELRREEM